MTCPNCRKAMAATMTEPTLRVWECSCGWRRVETGGDPPPKPRMTFAEAAAQRRH